MEAGDQDLAIAGIREQMALRTSLAKGIALSWSGQRPEWIVSDIPYPEHRTNPLGKYVL